MADGWRERYAATSFGFNAYGFDPQGNLSVEDSSFDTTLPAQNVYVFDGYGNRLVGERVSNGSTTAFNVDPVQFGGQYGYYTDTSTGEVDLTHRYYDTATGHFLNRDPIGYSGGENLYAYCDNNPINESDPEGTSGSGSLWQRFCRWFMGSYHVKSMGGDRGDEGLDANDLSSGGTPQLIQHPAQSAQFVNHGAKAAVATMALSVIPLPGGAGTEAEDVGFALRTNMYYIRRFAPGVKSWVDLGLDSASPEFGQQLMKMMSTSKQIHFDLSDMKEIGGIIDGSVAAPESSTNWELRTIWNNPELRAKTTFYNYGKKVPINRVLKIPTENIDPR